MSHTPRRPRAMSRTTCALLVAGSAIAAGTAPASATLLGDGAALPDRTSASATDDGAWTTPHDHDTDEMPGMEHDDMPGMDDDDMPDMDHGQTGGPGHTGHDGPAPAHPGGAHDASPGAATERPRGLVLGGFGLLNGAVLGAAAVLRRRTRGRPRPRAATTRQRTTD